MRVLLFSVTAGEGHNATARAIASILTSQGAETKIVDAYRLAGRFMYHLVSKGYLVASSSLKYGYGLVYRMLEHRRGNAYRLSPARLSGRSLAKKFARVIAEYDPDVIVGTHPFTGRILDITKERHGFRAKTVAVVTDFTLHPYWEEALRLDRLILPGERLLPLAEKKGFAREQLRPFGIPIRKDFAVALPKGEARVSLGLSPTLPTLLLMGGSMGYGNMRALLCRLDKLATPHQCIVVCANNAKMLKSIQRHTWKNPVLALGFVDFVPRLMDAANVIVSKPGGITSAEALVKRLPMIIPSAIPGHEDHNVRFLTETGAALSLSRRLSLTDAVASVLFDPERQRAMQAAIDTIRKPLALDDLCREIFFLAEKSKK